MEPWPRPTPLLPIPPPTTVTRSPMRGAASHSALMAVSSSAASTARPAGTPLGTGSTASALRRCGYRVHSARSDWLLDGRRDVQALALQRALIDGIAMAALEQAPASTALVQAWRQRRQVLAPRSVLRIGHLDVLALPPH